MIHYDLTDWELVEEIDQLSDGEIYFVAFGGEVRGLMEFNGSELSNENEYFDLSENIPHRLYIMEMNWPMPPTKAKECESWRKP